jgi:hypothetical protein
VAVDPTKFLKALAEGGDPQLGFRIALCVERQKANPSHRIGLLP